MTKPSERDLERAREIVTTLEDDFGEHGMIAIIAEALASERASLPESALDEIEMAISYLQTAVGLCEQLHEHVGDHDAAYISLSGEFEQAHDDLKEELEKIRRWQTGEGPEPRKDGET